MPVTDYLGINGFSVRAESAQDVYEVLDRMHTQIIDELEHEVSFEETKRLKKVLQILELAMEKLDAIG
jgi:uroporphyrinogen-III decarboxylase